MFTVIDTAEGWISFSLCVEKKVAKINKSHSSISEIREQRISIICFSTTNEIALHNLPTRRLC